MLPSALTAANVQEGRLGILLRLDLLPFLLNRPAYLVATDRRQIPVKPAAAPLDAVIPLDRMDGKVLCDALFASSTRISSEESIAHMF